MELTGAEIACNCLLKMYYETNTHTHWSNIE